MKYRNGFISNSSSSSFVVAFSNFPESAEELRVMLFGNSKKFKGVYGEDNWDSQEIAEVVFEQMLELKPLDHTPENIGGILESGYYVGIPNPDDYVNYRDIVDGPEHDEQMKQYHAQWDAFYEASKAKAEKIAKSFLEIVEGQVLIQLTFSDNDGDMSADMEHGDLFHKLPHLHTSHH